jgi:membrane protein implicated in regulation of membrane protease activity
MIRFQTISFGFAYTSYLFIFNFYQSSQIVFFVVVSFISAVVYRKGFKTVSSDKFIYRWAVNVISFRKTAYYQVVPFK